MIFIAKAKKILKKILSNYFDDKFKIKVLDDRNYEKAVSDRQDKHKCFAVVDGKSQEIPFSNKMYCESYHTNLEQIGIWDGPCQKNEECPFYKGNKNYGNKLSEIIKYISDSLPRILVIIGVI